MDDETPLEDAQEASPAMSPEQLATYLQEMEREAITWRSGDLASEQSTAIDFYEGKPFGDEVKGRSQVVVPVVQETVDYMTVSVLRTFVSGDRVVEFDPAEEEHEQAAEDATEALNQMFMRDQDGYKVLHDWLQTGLIEKIGAVKSCCIEDKRRKRERASVTPEQLAVLMEQVNVTHATERDDGMIDIVVETTTTKKRYLDLPVPNYEFLFSARTRHEDESDYLCHRSKKTASELIEMGFDRDIIDGLNDYDEASLLDQRETSTWDDEFVQQSNNNIPGMRRYLLREEYARIDYDGDGVAELLQVFRIGNKILDADEVENQPFTVFCPFPRAHRMVGNSLADKVMDLQRNQSVIMRQTFDGFYMTNAPRMWLDETSIGDTTIDDILTVAPGVIVRGRGQPPVPLSQPYDVGRSMALIEHLKGEQESRTGITRLNQGLDADTLNKTAQGQAQLQAQGQQIEEFVARNFAEALSRLFVKKMKLMAEHGEPVSLRVDGQFKQVDPTTWPEDMAQIIRVGLGSGSKEKRMEHRLQIAQMQAEAFPLGLATKKNLYNTGAGFVRDAGLGNPNDFFADPDTPEGQQEAQQPQEDPAIAAAKVKAQTDMQIAQMNTEAKVQSERERSVAEIGLAREKNDAEIALAREQMILKAASDHEIKSNRPGGSLAA